MTDIAQISTQHIKSIEESPAIMDLFENQFQKIFFAYFHIVPNMIQLEDIECQKANKWFLEQYSEEITECFYTKRYFPMDKTIGYDDIIYILLDDLMIHIDTGSDEVLFLFRKTNAAKVDEMVTAIKKYRRRSNYQLPKIRLLINSLHGMDTKPMPINKPKLSVEDNYNDSFLPIHQTIIKRLSQKNDKGLVLLHGKPGTGKTSYIRYLITKVKKPVIFLPPNMAGEITSPGLMDMLIDNPNSIFVIEDAENIIVDRNKRGGSPVSALLNIADGLLSDCLNIQLVCSFNTDLSQVDDALMRKGRLIAQYEFTDLEAAKAQALSNKLGFTTVITKPMTLTAIYNQKEDNFQHIKRKYTIGFSHNNNA
ncbi:hypothetical protein FACS189452_00270 [Bacteroidia bacterium]|nr:hypothetical protein FACS189452_00270 [Bacteroidia bacterium]GHT80333.1 hypothetical protein FACS189467_2240 [Bacteroidia bacterium]